MSLDIGRRRRLTACKVDSIIGMPLSTLSFAYSTIRIAFFADRPINVINPICAYTLLVKRGTESKCEYGSKHTNGYCK